MATAKVAITLDRDLLAELDALVSSHAFPSRSRAIQEAVLEKLDRLRKQRLAQECDKLEPQFEQQVAEEGIDWEASEWPEY